MSKYQVNRKQNMTFIVLHRLSVEADNASTQSSMNNPISWSGNTHPHDAQTKGDSNRISWQLIL